MKRALIIAAVLFGTVLSASAATDGTATSGPAPNAADQTIPHPAKKPTSQARKPAPRSSSNTVTYNRDSKNPNIGWHTVNGMRQCTQDCDNPEIPGSGYTCRNVNALGMAMRECTWSSW